VEGYNGTRVSMSALGCGLRYYSKTLRNIILSTLNILQCEMYLNEKHMHVNGSGHMCTYM